MEIPDPMVDAQTRQMTQEFAQQPPGTGAFNGTVYAAYRPYTTEND